ncbi:MAG: lipid-A-disaccharide synthase, partial [Firmicutes bacterium]|nr:lipid-A-disaccharide synthase [Bacillota bacterium]
LQTALWQVPMVVVYRVSEPSYLLARRLVKVPHIALPNIVAQRRLVEELVQHDARAERVAQAVLERLRSPGRLDRERRDLETVRAHLGAPGATARAARLVLEVAGG